MESGFLEHLGESKKEGGGGRVDESLTGFNDHFILENIIRGHGRSKAYFDEIGLVLAFTGHGTVYPQNVEISVTHGFDLQ